jgi:acetyltransferase-like isoleucine patch superfamily enzyme
MKAKIFETAKIVNSSSLTIGDNSQIDDFVFLNAGQKTIIGQFVHISSFCSITGGGTLIMEDFSGLAAGCRIITGSDDFSGNGLTNPTVSEKFKNVSKGVVTISRHAILGVNVIVFPGVIIGEGAAVGAGSIVRKNLNPWTIYAGTSCREVRSRNKDTILNLERDFLEEVGS